MKDQLIEILAAVIAVVGIFVSFFVMISLPFAVYDALQTPEIQSVLAKQNLSFLPEVSFGLGIMMPFIVLSIKISDSKSDSKSDRKSK